MKRSSAGAPIGEVWAALRDIGALHTRLVPGFVTNCRLDEDARIVTFANGLVASELVVDVSDAERRVTLHNVSAQVFAKGTETSWLIWIADLLPNEFAGMVSSMIGQALAAMQRRFSRPS